MKVLFVHSVKNKNIEVSPFTKSQADSLVNKGLEVDFFSVNLKKGFGIISQILKLKKIQKSYDIVHAHYATNALVSLLSGTRKKLVVSYLGSDIFGFKSENESKTKTLLRYFKFLGYLFL